MKKIEGVTSIASDIEDIMNHKGIQVIVEGTTGEKMPDGKTHNTINMIILVTILSGLYGMFGKYNILLLEEHLNIQITLIFSISYLFGTFFLSPDLDINSSAYERWGIFRILWWPYKELFKHRGLSHHPLLGPLTILFNFALILTPIMILVGINLYRIPVDIVVAIVLGIAVSIESHIVADMVVSEIN